MVTEVAIFTAIPGKEEELAQGIIRGIDAIRRHPECISAHATRCIEQSGRFMIYNTWTSFEAHTVDFRNGPLFAEWRSHINGLFADAPEVFHYEAF
ncbi:putative quinol monooxygenase [Ktedonospora formicarum]|uniref:Antibiotic biosynthesis monooxygenase n=1 Tax=Ktedonospora formicarum TaxID=2778364 RepID=A0A8J3HTM4_9CHLR|nr:antibiotic biosynthesis monooxygenase family protein [Ktedonospora formicarum]GHO43056.1 antibiotic biosynthesis monooxygenase [Ktedonospora formicarum]